MTASVRLRVVPKPIIRLRVLPKLIPLDGKSVEMQTTATHIQWRLVGSSTWTNLVALADITGPKGNPGDAAVTAETVAAAGAVMTTATDASSFGFVLDEDDMASDSDVKVPTQQSVKAYVDAHGLADGSVTDAKVASGSNLENRLTDWATIRDQGAAESETDNLSALVAAVTAAGADGVVRIPAGTFKVQMDSTGMIGLPANMKIVGEGKERTKLEITIGTTSWCNVFNLTNDGVTFKDLWIHLIFPAGGQGALFNSKSNGTSFIRCRFSSNADYVGGAATCSSYMLNSAGTADDIKIIGCEIHNWLYPYLKTNAQSFANHRWDIKNCTFYDNINSHFSINSPAGIFDDAQFIGNHFKSKLIKSSSASGGSMLAIAHVTNCTIANNSFVGDCEESAIHVEEGSDNLRIIGNSIDIDSTLLGHGIFVLDNDVGDGSTYVTSKRVVIANNTVKTVGTASGRRGIYVVYDVSGSPAITELAVIGNIVEGFERGISLDEGFNSEVVQGNVVSDASDIGIFTYAPTPAIKGNTIINCATGIGATRQGFCGKNHFVDCTAIATATNGDLTLAGWEITVTGISFTGSSATVTVPLVPVGIRFYGTLTAMAHGGSATNRASGIYTVACADGSTLGTNTSLLEYEPGSIAIAPAIGSSNLNLSVFNSSTTISDGRVQASFDGMHVFN